jgi:hypothetical protein
MNNLPVDDDLIKYTYDRGSIKILDLMYKHIHKYNDIKELSRIIQGIQRDINNELTEYENRYGVVRD